MDTKKVRKPQVKRDHKLTWANGSSSMVCHSFGAASKMVRFLLTSQGETVTIAVLKGGGANGTTSPVKP